MTKQSIDKICKALVDEINGRTKLQFVQSVRDTMHADCQFKGINLAIDIHFEFDRSSIIGISYVLTIDNEKPKALSLEELLYELQMITSYANPDSKHFECCLCGRLSAGYGNNAMPLAKGVCCDRCNETKVIPARLKEMQDGSNE